MTDKQRPTPEVYPSSSPTATQMKDLQDRMKTMLEESHAFLGGIQAKALHEKGRPVSGRQDRGRPVLRPSLRGMATSTPLETTGSLGETTERMPGRQLQDGREAVDSYVSSQSTTDRCRVPPMSPPKFEIGGDWRCFLAEFEDMVRLADLQPSHQLAYLKQAIPVEAKRLLYQMNVKTYQQAKQFLQELYEPEKDMWSVLNELQKIKQKPGERLRVLAGRIEEVARRYAETMNGLTKDDLDELVASRFKESLEDEETRNHLLWDQSHMSLDEMIRKAQSFQDAKQSSGTSHRTMRVQTDNSELERLKKQIQDLQQQLAKLSTEDKKSVRTTSKSSPKASSRKWNGTCWNCGEKGHRARECKKPKSKNGKAARPHKSQDGQALN